MAADRGHRAVRIGRSVTMSREAGPATVVITGGSSGIGRCTAALFARRGWRVGLIARGAAGLEAALADVVREGAEGAVAIADVADEEALDAAAAALERALGPIDLWINCAGNGTYGRFLDTPAASFRRVTDVTYGGTVNGTRVALRRMRARDRGRVVNVCSAVAFHGMPLMGSYSGAKAAVRGFDQAIRAELRAERSAVRLVTVFPPAVNTPFFAHAPSTMERPARPIPPVYQPEVVALAIAHAATTRRSELAISFTVVLFGLGVRFTPALVRRAIERLGYAGLLDRRPDAVAAAPTLLAPAAVASPVHGPFGAEARQSSWQVRLHGIGHAVAAGSRRIARGLGLPRTRVAAEPGAERRT